MVQRTIITWLIVALPCVAACFTYGYKNNDRTGKQDLVVTVATPPDITGLDNYSSSKVYLKKSRFSVYSASRQAEINSKVKSVTAALPVISSGGTTPSISLASVPFSNISTATRGFVPYSSATRNVKLGPYSIGANSLNLSTSPVAVPAAKGVISWNTDEDTIDVQATNQVVQVGQELSPLLRNMTGSAISNMTPVMFAGAVGASGRMKIQPAIADGSIPAFYTFGVTTEDIVNGADGHVTSYGKVRGVNTSGSLFGETWADGDILYISPTTAGWLTKVPPDAPNLRIEVAAVVKAHATMGTIFVRPTWSTKLMDLDDVDGVPPTHGDILQYDSTGPYWKAASVFGDMKDPTGFVDPDTISCTYDSTARTATCTQTGGIAYYWHGVKHTLASPWTSSAHTNSAGKYFLYSADGTTFTWSTTPWSYDQLQVIIANYGASDKFGLAETHGLMPWQSHREAHDLLGTYRVSGGSLTAGTYTENTATDAATTPGFDVAVIKDEDVSHTIPAWTEGVYTTMRIGAGSAVTFDATASFPFRSSGSYILVNNPLTGAETAGSTGQYVNVYQIMIPATDDVNSQKYRMVMLQPQKAYTSLAAAQAEDSRALSLGDLATQSPEYVIYARITYSLSASDGNTGKCKIATGGVTYVLGSRQGQTSAGAFIPGPSASATYIVQTADTTIPNAQDMSALATGIVKNTTGTGVQSIAIAGDFPTLNQNTTGTAAGLSGTPSISVTNITNSGIIRTDSNSVSLNNATPTTIYTLPTVSEVRVYQVSTNIGAVGDAVNWGAYAIIITDGATARIANNNGTAIMIISLSGMNIQLQQNSGGTQTGHINITRLH